METTPLEALVVKPDEVLVLRIEDTLHAEAVVAEILQWAEKAGLEDRVVVFTGEIDMAVIQSESADGLRG